MENLDNFFDILPFDNSKKTEKFAPYEAVRQSWAAGETISQGDSNWILGNFSNSLSGAYESDTPSRIARRAILFVKYAGECEGKSIYLFIHS